MRIHNEIINGDTITTTKKIEEDQEQFKSN